MDLMKNVESGYIHISDLNRIVADCRLLARKLDLTIGWRIKNRTTTGILRYNGHVVWRDSYTNELPHIVLFMLYNGIFTELSRRDKENRESIIRMRQLEEERNRERQVSNMPDWSQRRNSR